MTAPTPEPPAPTPSARTRCAWCDRQLPLGAWTYCSADCKQEAWLHSIVPPASAPAATPEPRCRCGAALTDADLMMGGLCRACDNSRPAAPTGEEAETLKALRDAADILRRYSCRPLADDLDAAAARLTAQATELAALRADRDELLRQCALMFPGSQWAERYAALAPRQTTGDNHAS